MSICHDVDYEVKGGDMQFVEIGLDTGETVVAEAGAMMFLEEGIAFETRMGDGSEPDAGMFKKLKSAAGRVVSQESVFLTHFTNSGGGRRVAAFSSGVPGKIVPLDMAKFGGSILAQKDAFLAAALGTLETMTEQIREAYDGPLDAARKGEEERRAAEAG